MGWIKNDESTARDQCYHCTLILLSLAASRSYFSCFLPLCWSGLSSPTSCVVVALQLNLVIYLVIGSFPSAGHDLELIDHPVLVLR